jgi:hypothetical protein
MQDAKMDIPGEGAMDGFGTSLFLPYREYYDGNFRASVLLAHEGVIGMLFRYVDPFNYYAF